MTLLTSYFGIIVPVGTVLWVAYLLRSVAK